MVSFKPGDVLSTLLPGAVALVAVSPFFPTLGKQVDEPNNIGAVTGVALLIAAGLAGGVLEAFTRVVWERRLIRWSPSYNALGSLTPDTLELYERAVQGNYKYATFYANFAWATVLLLVSRAIAGRLWSGGTLILVAVVLLLLRASYVQWTYFVHYLKNVFPPKGKVTVRGKDAE